MSLEYTCFPHFHASTLAKAINISQLTTWFRLIFLPVMQPHFIQLYEQSRQIYFSKMQTWPVMAIFCEKMFKIYKRLTESFFAFYLFIFFWKSAQVGKRCRGEGRILSRLHAKCRSRCGLNPTTMGSWPEPKNQEVDAQPSINGVTQAPKAKGVLNDLALVNHFCILF